MNLGRPVQLMLPDGTRQPAVAEDWTRTSDWWYAWRTGAVGSCARERFRSEGYTVMWNEPAGMRLDRVPAALRTESMEIKREELRFERVVDAVLDVCEKWV